MKKIEPHFLLVLTIFFLFSCSTKKAKEVSNPKIDDSIQNINFFLETSGSMGGYLNGSADLAKNIPNLLIDIENRVDFKNKPIKINYISENIQPYGGSNVDFITDITTTKVALGKSSQMNKIFESVTNETGKNDVSILISDCILSYSDKDIKLNPLINQQKADGALKAFIKSAFFKMKKQQINATVYAFNSKFFGIYYNFQNGKVKLNGEERPYYMWLIGRKPQLQKIKKQLNEIANFKPLLTIDFGMFAKALENYQILFKTEHAGKWRLENTNISDIVISKKEPLKFAVTADFSSLPDYASQIAYLKTNLKIDGNNVKCSISEIKKADTIDLAKAAPKEKEILQTATHVIIVEVSDIFKPTAEIKLSLPLNYDTSYANWSTMDDKSLGTRINKTFAFVHLLDGVREAYQNTNDKFVNISITLNK